MLDTANLAGPISWPGVFGNDHPVEIEVGFGKGLFLVTAGPACPKVNFLGIEIQRKFQLSVANRLAKRELKNVRVACTDARNLMTNHVPPGSVQAVHVYFPDPWWKKRHRKRRVFTLDFCKTCQQVLQAAGKLHVVTDVQDYFAIITELLAATQFTALPVPEPDDPSHDLDYLTNFERKYRKEGRPIYRGMWVR